MSSLTAPPRAHRINLIDTRREDTSICGETEVTAAVFLRFEAAGSVVGSFGLREKTSISRRTISLQPPLDGQQMSIFAFFFAIADDEMVGDWSVESDDIGIGYRISIYPFLNDGMENDHLPVEALGQCRWSFVIFQFREVLDTCRSSLDSRPWCHTSWTPLRWSHVAETHCKPRRWDTLKMWIFRLILSDLLGNISLP